MEIIKEKNGRREMDLAAAAILLFRKAWLIVLVAMISGALSLAYTYLLVEPSYEATAAFYVSNMPDSAEVRGVTTSDLSASMMLMYAYGTLIKSEEMMEEAIALSGTEYSVEDLMLMIDVSAVENTKILTVTATSSNPEEAALLANSVAEVAPDRLEAVERGSSVRVLSRARVPKKRTSPSYSKAILAGGVIGGFLSIATILLKEILDTKIRKKEEITSLGYPLLGEIPARTAFANGQHGRKSADKERLADPDVMSDLQVSLKQLEENVLFSIPGTHCKRILFAGITPEVRKTTAVVNLATRMAADGRSMLLMDCDLRRAEIAELLSLKKEPGMSSILTGQASTEYCMQHYGENLDVIVSGVSSPNASELLSSDEMRTLLEQVEAGHEFIFMNTAPLKTDGLQRDLYSAVSGIILVVRTGVTRRDELREFIEQLENAGGRILGFVAVSDRGL